jgi:hypothetical protein
VEAGESLMEELPRRMEEGFIQAAEDDAGEGPGLPAAHGGPVRLYDGSSPRVEPQSEALPAEAVHRDGDPDVVQEPAQPGGMVGIVQARGEMHPQRRRLDDGIEGRTGSSRRQSGDGVGAAVLGATVQRHEADGGAQDTLLFDAGKVEELLQVHRRWCGDRSRMGCDPTLRNPTLF